jgi:hypothetical protein
MTEILGAVPVLPPHLTQASDFREGRLWPNARPGLGVDFDPNGATLVADITEREVRPFPTYRRPDGSLTNW